MDLTDKQWEILNPLLPNTGKWKPGGRGRPPKSARRILDGILWILRTGAPWNDMPGRYPSGATCFRRFQQWRQEGALRKILEVLYKDLRERGRIDDIEALTARPNRPCSLTPHKNSTLQVEFFTKAFIDGTYVGAKKGGSSVGRSRAGKTTKIMAIADGNGLPTSISIADGSKHDVSLVEQTLDASFGDGLAPLLIGDKAFDSKKLAESLLEGRDIELISPRRGGMRPRVHFKNTDRARRAKWPGWQGKPAQEYPSVFQVRFNAARRVNRPPGDGSIFEMRSSKRKQDGRKMRRYKKRWKVERLFAWLKRYRRIAIRWERKAENYLAFVYLGCLVILLRQF